MDDPGPADAAQAVACAAHRLGRGGGRADGGRGGRRLPADRTSRGAGTASATAMRSRRRASLAGPPRSWRSAFSPIAVSNITAAPITTRQCIVAPSAAAVSLINSVHMMLKPEVSSTGRLALSGLTLSTGLTGLAFHLTNVARRDGGVNLLNLFYGAPLLAPGAIAISGLAGLAAARLVAEAEQGSPPTLLGRPAGMVVGLGAAVSMLSTTAEAALLHFRGAFHDPFMYVPVTLPPRRRWCWRPPPSSRVCANGAPAAAADRGGRGRRLRVPRLRGEPQHGRVLQLEPEPPERAADTGAALVHRRRIGRARGGAADGGRLMETE